MDRDQLAMLLSSGKFLCYNPNRLDGDAADNAAQAPDPPPPEIAAAQIERTGKLFDSPLLDGAVFFKEAVPDDDDEFSITTRAMIAFNQDNAYEGGASFVADPDQFEQTLEKWFGRKVPVTLSPHDRDVLEVLWKTPTFDPFLLMAQKEQIERNRPVDPAYFSTDPATAEAVRAIIATRARKLVDLALGTGASDVRRDATVEALIEAVWSCETNHRTGLLLQSLLIPPEKNSRILFAWKGISYYNHLFDSLGGDYADFLTWLKSLESLPKDEKTIPSTEGRRIRSLRRRAQVTMRGYFTHATEILKKYDQAYTALIEQGDPAPFQQFLLAAPGLFETLGLSIGSFGHASNAWKTLTNNGRRRKRKAAALDPFYRFVADLAATQAG